MNHAIPSDHPPQGDIAPPVKTTVVLAMSADGKVADGARSPARFASDQDRWHLQQQIAAADAVLFGASTLRAYGSTLSITHPRLLQRRQRQQRPLQPVHIVCSQSAQLNPTWRFFQQPVPRWLLTTPAGATHWGEQSGFEHIVAVHPTSDGVDWQAVYQHLKNVGIRRLAVLGGGRLVASLLAVNRVDEIWLTVCPLLLGGATAPTPVDGAGFLEGAAPRLQLLSVTTRQQEVFLHYRVQHSPEVTPDLPRERKI